MSKPISALIHAKLIIDNSFVENKVLLFDTHIIAIIDEMCLNASDDIHIIDAKGAYVSAGFIDLHIHGSGGADVMDASFEALEVISSILPSTGTTSFLATTMTMSDQKIKNALHAIKKNKSKVSGAHIIGIHLEGPFLNPKKHGAQDKVYIQKPNLSLILDYMDDIRMITLAPEVAGSKSFIQTLVKEYPHILLSIGHSEASYEESVKSFEWGISHATHLFNAMNPYHHREPGIVGAVFDSDVSCDIIADLIHTHQSTLSLVHQMKKEKLILITDAMRAGCMKCGRYTLGGQQVEVFEGKALLKDGTLAGSVLQMNEALGHMLRHTSMTLIEAIHSVTKIPAQKLDIKKGELKVGFDADIVIFDEELTILSTFVAGEKKYHR